MTASDDAVLAMFARDEQALFTSSCEVTAPDPAPTFDPETGQHIDVPTVVYDGPCLVRPVGDTERTVLVAGTPVTVGDYLVKVPADVAVTVGCQVTVTDGPRDAGLAGKYLTVVLVLSDEWQVTRRLLCEEVTP